MLSSLTAFEYQLKVLRSLIHWPQLQISMFF